MYIAILIFFVFLLLGMPVAFAIGVSGFSFFMMRDLPMTILVQKCISPSQSFTMLAIPLFILAGNLMNSCGITSRLMKFANACTGHLPGNIGQVSCLLSTLMGGVSGSVPVRSGLQDMSTIPRSGSRVTTRSPASPVNPVSHSTCFHLGAGYSEQ